MPGAPFFIIPWDKDFLEHLANIIIEKTKGQPGSAVVVFTHDRPRRYLTKYLQNHPDIQKPCLLPQMLTIQELWVRLIGVAGMKSCQEIGLIDQVSILFSCVQRCSFESSSMLEAFSGIEIVDFFPWGVQLAGLIEECLVQGVEPESLLYAEGEVEPFAAALLGSLGQVFALYKEHLIANHQTTHGLNAFIIADQLYNNTDEKHLLFFEQKTIFLSGFSRLSKTENTLFHYLWERGAYICLHVDAWVAETSIQTHWACDAQVQWIRSWDASTELVCPPEGKSKKWHFFAGYDLHSQLKMLYDDLQLLGEKQQESTAIVLTHSNLLLPVLYHLPDKQCNISLGYPLSNSLLFRLLELIIKLRDSSQEDGSIYYRALIDLLRHPYIRLFEGDGFSLRESLQFLEQYLLNGRRYIHVSKIFMDLDKHTDTISNEQILLLKHVLENLVCSWLDVQTLSMMAKVLSTVCDMFLAYGSIMWEKFPLDAECLFRIIHQVVPSLKNNRMSEDFLSWELLKLMFYALIDAERVPFEADPLIGLQVLGMLETRLLQFSKIFILDVTEDHLPGIPIKNPLLPDNLRSIIGLPDTKHRDLLIAYTFYRLLAGAEDVYIYWQEGIESSGIFDSKKQRSRFVEEILWQEEQHIGKRITLDSSCLRSVSLDIQPPVKTCRDIVKTPLIHDRLMLFLGKPLSATLLDSYLSCPLRFYFEKLCVIQPINYLCEDDNHVAVGQLLHNVLSIYYKDYIGKVCYTKELSESLLKDLFFEELDKSGLMESLPPESAMMLKISGPEKLIQFLHKQPDKIEVIHIEQYFQATLVVNGKTRVLEGILDRIDRRDNKAVILDYKTGLLRKCTEALWKDTSFWKLLASSDIIDIVKSEVGNNILSSIAKNFSSIQLPYYIYLYTSATGEDVHDAAYVSLRDTGEEYWFLESLATSIKEDNVFERISNLLRFLVLHMECSPSFTPIEGKHCSWCLWNTVCKVYS